jgi:hypothetical protein
MFKYCVIIQHPILGYHHGMIINCDEDHKSTYMLPNCIEFQVFEEW